VGAARATRTAAGGSDGIGTAQQSSKNGVHPQPSLVASRRPRSRAFGPSVTFTEMSLTRGTSRRSPY
jgi:hypothetical protein